MLALGNPHESHPKITLTFVLYGSVDRFEKTTCFDQLHFLHDTYKNGLRGSFALAFLCQAKFPNLLSGEFQALNAKKMPTRFGKAR